MPSSNQVTTKCCIWQNYNYNVMITAVPNKAKKCMPSIHFSKYSCAVSRVTTCHSWNVCHVFNTTALDSRYWKKKTSGRSCISFRYTFPSCPNEVRLQSSTLITHTHTHTHTHKPFFDGIYIK